MTKFSFQFETNQDYIIAKKLLEAWKRHEGQVKAIFNGVDQITLELVEDVSSGRI